MGRKRVEKEKQKIKIAITLSENNLENLKDLNTNRSKLINWLFEQHFGLIQEKHEGEV